MEECRSIWRSLEELGDLYIRVVGMARLWIHLECSRRLMYILVNSFSWWGIFGGSRKFLGAYE